MYRILIWGTGKGYNACIGSLRYLESIGDIHIVGITSNDNYYSVLDGIRFIPKSKLKHLGFDYIIVAANNAYEEICNEAVSVGIENNRILSSNVVFLDKFSFKRYISLVENPISIISNNCWAGATYHYLHMKFQSPFINMYIDDDDYLRLLCNLRDYVAEPLVYFNKEVNPVDKFEYPVFCLGDIKLHMNHYRSIEEGEQSWYKRVSRINWENLFVMMYTHTEQYIRKFSNLPFEKKVCFVGDDKYDYPSIMPVKPYICKENKNRMLWEYVLDMASGRLIYYDVWSLLLEGKFEYRVK